MEERDNDEGPGVPDMTMMPQITEHAINDNLKRRYKHDLVYTYTGSILVAVNPYKELGCYTMEHMQNYRGKAFGSLEPHVFALAESAYSSLQNGEKNQSVVISGESGAGKTETTKLILQYLCAAGGQASWAEQQILEANTVLEAFGNAKTVRNDNSSRFGKFVEVRLDHRGGIKGAVLRDFLLERARITGPAPRETNYHVFYQLVEGAKHNAELRSTLRLRDDIHYKYLRPEDEEARKGRLEQGKLEALQLALTVLQVPPHMCEGLFKVLAAVLWLGNIQFQDVDGERSTLSPEDTEAVDAVASLLGLAPPTAQRVLLERQINVRGNVTDIPLRLPEVCYPKCIEHQFPEDTEAVDAVANLLGLAPPTAQRVLLERQINVRGNVTDIPLRLPEARENRHAMARALYSRTFAWLVRHVNSCSAPGRSAPRALGVLDIFGFENFAANSLEQLCINYANEKLHMFFNNYVFALEQEIYRQEGIVYNQIQFTDNAACLELLEKPPRSLLKLLSEQCHMPKGSDGAYLTNIQGEFGEHQSFVKGSRRKWEEEFGVQHYAGTVTYSVQGFVDKNRDTQQDAFIDHLSRSANPFVRELADYVQDLAPPGHDMSLSSPNSTGTTQRGTSKGRPTVVDTFRCQLQSLVDMLQATDVWYVRCIKPNENKEAGKYNDQLVLEQLKYLGMNEIVRIRRDGYPVHLPAPHFQARYRCLLPHPRPRNPDVTTIMAVVNAPKDDWQIGHTKIFMRSSVHSPLEAKRTGLLQSSAMLIQKWYKGSVKRRQYIQWRSAVIVLQAAWRGWKERAAFLRLRRAAMTLQRHLRGAFAREVAAALREMKRVNQEIKLREERNSLAEKACAERAELENMAEQLRGLAVGSGPRTDSLNLDNLFDFLADVPAQRGAPDGQPDHHQPSIAEIGDSMDKLADDLHQELEHVLAAEMDELSKSHTEAQRKPDGAPSDAIPPPPPSSLPLQNIITPSLPPSMTSSVTNGMSTSINGMSSSITNGMSPMSNGDAMSSSLILPPPPPPMSDGGEEESPVFPPPPACSLPEPAGPPPPPPAAKDTTPPELTNGVIPNGKLSVINGKEPIYESVIPRAPEPVKEPVSVAMPPPPPPQMPPENNGLPDKEPEPELEAPLPPAPIPVINHVPLPAQMKSPTPPPPPIPMDTCISPPPMLNGDSTSTERHARRKERVERRLNQMEAAASPPTSAVPPITPSADVPNDLSEFAKMYFNDHPRSPEGTIMATLTRKSKSMEVLTKEEMITYYKGSSIPTSHIQLHDPDSVTAAVNIFRDLCRYMRGELTADKETQVIQSVIAKGLEREELRDEILVQCVRQITECPVEDWAERIWLVLCLCAVAWQPSRGLARHYSAWLRTHARLPPPSSPMSPAQHPARAAHCAQWCLDNCRGAAPRQLPPSTVEIAAMRRLGTIVCRFFFLDGRTKAIDVHPADTAAAAAARLADKLGLAPQSRAGWAVYQQRGGKEEHVRATQYLYDVIAAWEIFLAGWPTKAIDIHPADTAAAAAARLADKLGLAPQSRAGWAVYQQRGGKEEHVRATQYLYDVIAAWEMQQGPGGGSADNRFVFKRRLFRGGRELPHDPVEVALLYAQAVHSVVKLDEFPVSEKVALQLAGLQAQVSLGEPPPSPPPPHTRAYYSHPDQFLPQRIARARPAHQWATILAQAHRQYGAGRAELTAKALYLSCVMQYPLYGVTLFPVTYKGYWAHGPNVLLGVGSEGVVLVRPADKVVLAEYPYSNIAALLMDPVDNGLTISLTHHGQHDGHRCIVLESPQKNEAAWLMAAYSPVLANGLADEPPRRAAPASERSRLAGALKSARRALVDSGMLRRPTELSAGNFLRNTLRRLSKHRLEKVRLDMTAESQEECYKSFPAGYWRWSRSLPHSLTKLNEAEEVAAMQIFKDIMSHAGLSTQEGSTSNLANNNSISSQESDSDDRVALAQALLQRCLQKDTLLCELYVQLIKQTTDHPEPSSRVSSRHWALLCAAIGAALPPAKPLRRLLLAHLRYRGAALHTGEDGKFARRAEQVALSIAQVPRRLAAPSKEELLCAAARRPMHVRVLLLDGKQHGLVFGPAATADHLVTMLREKIGLNEAATGYALYEVCAGTSAGAGTGAGAAGAGERALGGNERVGDVLARWEKAGATAAACSAGERALGGNERVGDVLARWEKAGATAAACRLVFKKRLFLGERPLHTASAAEMELLYSQVLHSVRHDRLPIETDEAVMLAALHAQVVSGDCMGGGEECSVAAGAVLPPRLAPALPAPALPAPAVRLHHLALRGTDAHAAMQRALTLAASWPLARATIFDVMQSFTSNWPRALWLAVDARGLTLLRRGSRAALVSHDHDQLLAVSPAPRALLLVTRADRKHAKLVLSTDQAYQIATLIKDYIEAVRGPVSPAAPPAAAS